MDPATPFAELDAMRKLVEALSSLEPASIARVLRWAHEQYGVSMAARASAGQPSPQSAGLSASNEEETQGVQDLADYYATCGPPKTDAHKALVVAYWLQEQAGEKNIDAQRVNTELKQLGHGVGNITRAFDILIGSKPQLVIQTKKSGLTKQARKLYRVTVEGRLFVENIMVRGRRTAEENTNQE